MTVLGDARLDQQPIVQDLMLTANSKVLAWGNPKTTTETPSVSITVPSGYGYWRCLIASWACGYLPVTGFAAIEVKIDGTIWQYHRNTQNQAGWKPHAPVFTMADLSSGTHTLSLSRYAAGHAGLSLNGSTWSYFVLGTPVPQTPREQKGSLGVRGVLGTFDLRDPLLLSDVAPSRFLQCTNGTADAGPWADTRKGGVISGQPGRNTLVGICPTAYNTAANLFAVLGCYLRRVDNNAVHADMGVSYLGYNEAASHHAFPPFIWYGQLPSEGVQAALRVGASTSSDANDNATMFAIHGV